MHHIATSQRRRKSASPSAHELAQAVIKQKKTITPEEFERLQHQLLEMVETTPQAQLAMTQTALANGLERPFTRGFPGPTSFPGYLHGSIANQNLLVQDERNIDSGYMTKSGAPICKRRRSHECGSILTSDTVRRGQLTREEQTLLPSRLLTGAKRDAATRSAYSAAVAENTMSMLNKVQTPLEAQKPTPSTSMSWLKYYLSMMDDQGLSVEENTEIDSSDVPPPTITIPRVVFPQPSVKPPTQSARKSVHSTPPKSANTASNGVTSLLSPQAVSMTPVSAAKASVSEPPRFQTIDGFNFTLPISDNESKPFAASDKDTRVKFVFSPPPSQRGPPLKVSNQNVAKASSGAAPFDLMSASPKAKATEFISMPQKEYECEKPKIVAEKPVVVEKAELKEAARPTSTNSVVNPLARFLQLKPGQWKCPGCSVLNEITSSKCPCCEMVKPGGGDVEKVSPAALIAPGSISSSGFSFGVTAADPKKDTEKSASGSIRTSGFCFDAQATELKKNCDKVNGSTSITGIRFNASAADSSKEATAGFPSGGFKFTPPSAISETEKTGVGNTVGSNADPNNSAKTAVISFGFSGPVNKTDSNLSKSSGDVEKAASDAVHATGFEPVQVSLGESLKAASAEKTASTVEGFSTGKRKAPEAKSSTIDSDSSFNFGVAATPTAAPTTTNAPNVSFGATLAVKQESPKGSERPMKRLARSFGATSEQAATKPPQVAVHESTKVPFSTSSFNCCTSASSSIATENPKATTPAVSFGVPAIVRPDDTRETKPRETKTGFTFGTSSTAVSKPIAVFGQTTDSKASGFSFSAYTASMTPTSIQTTSVADPSPPSFTFGSNTTTPSTANVTAFGAASSASTFGFGAPTLSQPLSGMSTSPTSKLSSAPASAPAFTFSSSATKPTGSTAFGQPAVSSSSLTEFGSHSSSGFGSGSTSGSFGKSSTAPSSVMFGSSTSSAPNAPAFTFGTPNQPPAANASASPVAFQFGAPSATACTGFGAASVASNSFGSSGPSGGFSAAPGGFQSSSSAPAFVHQAFGNPPTTTFGGAPATNAFGSGSPISGFSSTPAFGAAPNAAFGAPNPAHAFGAPAPGAFNVPSDGGFNMGAPPQHAKGRRILKARSRTRRT